MSIELPDLLTREEVEKWLYAFFMKTVLPTKRPAVQGVAPIFSPLNMSVLFRLLSTLFHNGYPARWLSGILSTLLNNEVETTARLPRGTL